MQIWIDGDACPKIIKDIIFRAALRTKTQTYIVSNHNIIIPPSPLIKKYQVSQGFDVADIFIVENLKAGDLVITADIPLANSVVEAKGFALNPRGEMYTENNIKQFLSLRNFNDSLRSLQLISGGPPKISEKEVRNFAKNLDKFIALQSKF